MFVATGPVDVEVREALLPARRRVFVELVVAVALEDALELPALIEEAAVLTED